MQTSSSLLKLFTLPLDILLDIFTGYLTLIDTTRFDTSLMNHEVRSLFLQLLQEKYLCFPTGSGNTSSYTAGKPVLALLSPNKPGKNGKQPIQTVDFFTYSLKRSIAVDSLHFHHSSWALTGSMSSYFTERKMPLQSVMRNLTSLHFDALSGLSVSMILSFFATAYSSSMIGETGRATGEADRSTGLLPLRSLAITGYKKLEDKDVFTILKYCIPAYAANRRHSGVGAVGKMVEKGDNNCKGSLTSINFSGCWKLTSSFLPFLAHYFGSNLLHLNFTTCFHLENDALQTFFMKIPALKSFAIAYNANISDATITRLVTSCPSLTAVHLSACVNLTDECMKSIAQYGKAMKYVDISGVKKISDVSLMALISAYKTASKDAVKEREVNSGFTSPAISRASSMDGSSYTGADSRRMSYSYNSKPRSYSLANLTSSSSSMSSSSSSSTMSSVNSSGSNNRRPRAETVGTLSSTRSSSSPSSCSSSSSLLGSPSSSPRSPSATVATSSAMIGYGIETLHMEGCPLLTAPAIKQLLLAYPSLKQLHVRYCQNLTVAVTRDILKDVQSEQLLQQAAAAAEGEEGVEARDPAEEQHVVTIDV